MAFLSDPVFLHSVKRNSGSKRRLINITSTEERDVDLKIKDLEKPEWVDIEGVFPGETLHFERGKPTTLIVNINTMHKFFPTKGTKEWVKVTSETDELLNIQVAIVEVVPERQAFRGVFAMDFGTTNSCYAYRGGTAQASKNLQRAKCSSEIPSAVYFHDVGDPIRPRYAIGTEALHDIRENSSRTYAYVLSAKRLLGQDRTMLIMDKLGGAREGHLQEWHVEELASFIIRELLERAEDELGQKIIHIVATFPPMFSAERKDAIRRSMVKALDSNGVPEADKQVVMNLDEANAGTFHYIYTNLLDEFRKFNIQEKKVDLLAYDFGGGTVDIALVGVKISRKGEAGQVIIETELKGLSGDAMLGGDNVTLALFRIGKWRVAKAAAERRVLAIEEAKKTTANPKDAVDNIWGAPPPKAGAKGKSTIFDDEPTKKREKAPEAKKEDLDPEMAVVVNRETSTIYEGAITTLAREKAILDEAILSGKSIGEVVAGKERLPDVIKRRTDQLEAAIETVVPTKFAQYTDKDPHKENLARALFYEIWHEMDALKIRLAGSGGEPRPLAGVLRKVAKYTGVDPITFNDLQFTLEELERRIEPKITETVDKAFELFKGASVGNDAGGIGIAVSDTVDTSNLRLLLFGNSSNLPIVRRKFVERFQIAEENLIQRSGQLKTAVAAGACDEFALRREMGEAGLIQYKSRGFLDRVPFSIGLYNENLSLAGWKNGFLPIFPRGTAINGAKELSEKSTFLIHEGLQELPIYVDYHDGSAPKTVGFIDFTKPIPGPGDPAVFEQAPEHPDAKFRIRLQVMPTRELIATNMTTGAMYSMVMEKAGWLSEENPFAGVH